VPPSQSHTPLLRKPLQVVYTSKQKTKQNKNHKQRKQSFYSKPRKKIKETESRGYKARVNIISRMMVKGNLNGGDAAGLRGDPTGEHRLEDSRFQIELFGKKLKEYSR